MIYRQSMLFLLLILFSAGVYAKPKVIDGDSLMINKANIRLYGIDAPEYDQTCAIKKKKYPCGQRATIYLKSLIKSSTKCVIYGGDKYKRVLAVCYNGKTDINAQIVKSGHALAYTRYTRRYTSQQRYAKKHKKRLMAWTVYQA